MDDEYAIEVRLIKTNQSPRPKYEDSPEGTGGELDFCPFLSHDAKMEDQMFWSCVPSTPEAERLMTMCRQNPVVIDPNKKQVHVGPKAYDRVKDELMSCMDKVVPGYTCLGDGPEEEAEEDMTEYAQEATRIRERMANTGKEFEEKQHGNRQQQPSVRENADDGGRRKF